MAQLILENIYKKYENAKDYAVNDVSFSCNDGEFVAILGPSGCGKTTTLRMIAGLESVSSGTISIDGKVINNLLPKDRGIGLAFEDYALYPPLNVYDNIAFNLKAKRQSPAAIKQQVQRIAELLHITDILHEFPRALSGGQKQRVNIARAIVRQPSVLLLDEPMSHLDGKLRQILRQELRRLHKEIGCTTIIVTHDQLEAMSLADRMVVMNFGNLQQFASPAELYSAPKNEFVAGFIGDPPMNIIDAVVVKKDSRAYFCFYNIELPIPRSLENQVADGQKVRFGVRPDDIELDPNGTPIKITVFENLGEEKRISLCLDDRRLDDDLYFMMSTLQNVEYAANDTIGIKLKENKVHLFR